MTTKIFNLLLLVFWSSFSFNTYHLLPNLFSFSSAKSKEKTLHGISYFGTLLIKLNKFNKELHIYLFEMVEKICQIALVGQNIEWILKGILLYNTNRLILISTNNIEFIEKIDDVKQRLLDAAFEKSPIEIEHLIIEGEDPIEFSTILKKKIIQLHKDGYKIEINATAGLRVWQILGFFISLQLEDFIELYFIINKKTGEPIVFPTEILSKTEQLFLDIISEKKNVD